MNILIDESYFLRWQGGRNYLKNILIALKESGAKVHRLKTKNLSEELDYLFDYTHVEVYPNRFSLNRIKFKINRKATWKKLNPWIDLIHTCFQVENADIQQFVKSVRWIPDFQHIEMPEQFSKEEIEKRTVEFEYFANQYDIILLSSYHAQHIFNQNYPFAANKSRVYQFKVTIPERVFEFQEQTIRSKYQLPQKYIHFPAQWWTHKNHAFIFEVMTQTDNDVSLVCTGKEEDYRDSTHSEKLKNYIKQYKLESKILLLGEIPYLEMLAIMRFSHVVITPSLYDAWSTTVEEAKLFGKLILCLNTPLFQEQLVEYEDGQLIEMNVEDWKTRFNKIFKTDFQIENKKDSLENQLKIKLEELFN